MSKCVIVSEKSSFIVNTTLKLFQSKGFDISLADPTHANFSSLLREAESLLIFTGNYIEYPAILSLLTEQIVKNSMKCILLGDTSSVFKLKEHIPAEHIVDTIENYYTIKEIALSVAKNLITEVEGAPKKILLVDDDPTFLKVVRIWLQDFYEVIPVNSGAQALEYLAHSIPDLILLDYEMPVLNGPQVLQTIRNEPRYKNIPVFFLTGVDSKDAVRKAVLLKPEGYILKSQDKSKLLSTLKYFFNQNK